MSLNTFLQTPQGGIDKSVDKMQNGAVIETIAIIIGITVSLLTGFIISTFGKCSAYRSIKLTMHYNVTVPVYS